LFVSIYLSIYFFLSILLFELTGLYLLGRHSFRPSSFLLFSYFSDGVSHFFPGADIGL
jgi:hypothetical protein